MGQVAFYHMCKHVHAAAGSVSHLYAAVQKLRWMCHFQFNRCLIGSLERMKETLSERLHPGFSVEFAEKALLYFCGSTEILKYAN